MACRLPESDSVNEFREHLMNNDDMVTDDDRRWTPGMCITLLFLFVIVNSLRLSKSLYFWRCFDYFSGCHGLPTRTGKLKDLTKFDATFFGVHSKQAARMDPQVRMLLEVTFEAIVDAGMCSYN